jgi:hypothetical protein
VAGWSYGGDVSGVADTSRVYHLIRRVLPGARPDETGSSDEPADLPWLLFPDNRTVELDTDWLLSTTGSRRMAQ